VRRVIRKHLRDFLAVFFLAAFALSVAGYILSQQRFHLPAWVPAVGSDFYSIDVELQTAQAVVPGQGQTMNIAGVKVGDVKKVTLREGIAVVSVDMEKQYAPVYRDATVLLRPKTGLKDMYLALDPGTPGAGALPEGGRIPVANTLPDVNPDEILAQLDTDTRAYLQILLQSAGEAFTDAEGVEQPASADLRETFKRFEPTNRDLAKLTGELSKRRKNVARVTHNLRLIFGSLADRDEQLGRLVASANANFEALARQDQNLRAALREFPGTLSTTRDALGKADTLGRELGPAATALRPAARALAPALRDVRPFLRDTTPIIRTQLRPFAREARPLVRELRPAARDLAATTPDLVTTFKALNALLNTLAYNPEGDEEGYLFWASWVNHAAATVFNTSDAHGAIRRGLVMVSCGGLGVLENLTKVNRQLAVLIDLLDTPRKSEACAQQTPGATATANGGGR
jgi:phospholipid/cholesterol/gamma-HCH transport system substrate-binding protein